MLCESSTSSRVARINFENSSSMYPMVRAIMKIRRIGEEAIYFEEWEDGAWKLVDDQIETLDEGEMERKGPDSA